MIEYTETVVRCTLGQEEMEVMAAKSFDKIKKDINDERTRRSNLTRADLKKAYLELKNSNLDSGMRIKFAADLAESNEISYHYELIIKDWEQNLNLYLENGFYKHDREGIEFLFGKLDENLDEKIIVYTAYLLAKALSQLKHREFYLAFCNKACDILVSLLDTNDDNLRCKVIIAIGWIGASNEIELLAHQLLCDEEAICRAWSASSLMQMMFNRVKIEELQERTKLSFLEGISSEMDLYASGIMIEAAQTIFGKRWISSSAVESEEPAAIEKARKSAVRFLRK